MCSVIQIRRTCKTLIKLVIPKRSSASTHNSRDECVDLSEGRVLDVEPVAGDAVERRVVQHHHAVRALRETLQC